MMPHRSLLVTGLLMILVSLAGCASNGSGSSGQAGYGELGSALTNAGVSALTGLLSKQLNVSPQQALGGAGAIFSSAQQNMNASDFNALAKAVPGMSDMLGAAPKTPAGSNMLNAAFAALGMESSMVQQFMPVILSYVKGSAGKGLMQSLQNALQM